MHDMIVYTGIHGNLNTGLWPEFTANATKLENIMVNPHKEKYGHKKFYRKMPDYAKNLRNFGAMVVVPIIATVKAKL